jgi:hypothetical protein
MSFEQFEPAQYRTPEQSELADPTKVGWIDDPNKKLESGKNPDKNTPNFDQAKKIMASNNASEADEKAMDHPTPEEILASLDGAFGGSTEKPKNSSESGSQVVEWKAPQRENPNNA